MRRFRILGLCALALTAMSAITAVTAHAAALEPRWKVETAFLLATGKKTVTDKAKSKFQTLPATLALGESAAIQCEKVSVHAAGKNEIIGSAAEKPGTDKTQLEYSGNCKVNEQAGCLIAEPILTKQLVTLLAWKEGTLSKTLDVFKPETGKEFVELEFKNCTKGIWNTKTKIEGEVAAEVKPIGTEQTAGEIIAPGAGLTGSKCEPTGAVIKEYFTGESGHRTKHAVEAFKAFGVNAEYCGEANVELNPVEKWGVFEG